MWFAIANSLMWIAFVVGGYAQSVESVDPGVQLMDLSAQPTDLTMDPICHSILSDMRDGKVNPNMTSSQMTKCAAKYSSSSTFFEELPKNSCRYNWLTDEFHCSVRIKQRYGYNGYENVGICVDTRTPGNLNTNREPDGIGSEYVENGLPRDISVTIPNTYPVEERIIYQAKAILEFGNPRVIYPQLRCNTIPTSGNVIYFSFKFLLPPPCKPCIPCLKIKTETQSQMMQPCYPDY